MGFLKHSHTRRYIYQSDTNLKTFSDVHLLTIIAIDECSVYLNDSNEEIHLIANDSITVDDMRIFNMRIVPVNSRVILGENMYITPSVNGNIVDTVARNQITNLQNKVGSETFTESNYVNNSYSILRNIDEIDKILDDLGVSLNYFGLRRKVELYQNFIADGMSDTFQLSANDNGLIVDKNGTVIPWDATNIDTTYGVEVTDDKGNAVYTTGNLFTRTRVNGQTVTIGGLATLSGIVKVGTPIRIHYVYNLPSNTIMNENYYKTDYLNAKEMSVENVTANHVVTDNTITGFTSTNLQDTLQEIDLILDNHLADDNRHLTTIENDALDNSNAPSASNPFATINDLSGVNGAVHPVVADTTELANISISDRIDKMLIPVDSNGYFYKYDSSSIAIPDGDKIVVPSDNVGRYIQFMKSTTQHNMLAGMQGGDGVDYYHLDQNDYLKRVTTDNTVTLKNKTIIVNGTDNNVVQGLQISDISGLPTALNDKVNNTDLVNYARKDMTNTFTAANDFTGGLKSNHVDVADISTSQTLYNKTIKTADGNIIEVNESDVLNLTNDLTAINNNINSLSTDLTGFEGKFDLSAGTVGQKLVVDTDGKIRPKTDMSSSGQGFDYEVGNELQLITLLTVTDGQRAYIHNYDNTGLPNIAEYHATSNSWVYMISNSSMPISDNISYTTTKDATVGNVKQGLDTYFNNKNNYFDTTQHTTDDITEGTTHLYYTDDKAKDSVGNALIDTNSVDFTYDGTAKTIKADVKVDNSTIEINTNGIQVKSLGIKNSHIDSGIDAIKIGSGNVTNTEFDSLDGISGNIQNQIDNIPTDFIELTDTPTTYVGQAGKIVAINQAENGVEFINPPSSGVSINVYDEGTLVESNINTINFVGTGVTASKVSLGKVNVTINTSGGGGGGSVSTQEVVQSSVVASSSAPYKVQIPTTIAYGSGILSPTIWKFIAGTSNVVNTISDFNNSDSINYQSGTNVLFDGKLHLNTLISNALTDNGALGNGKLFSITIDTSDFKNIESLEVV